MGKNKIVDVEMSEEQVFDVYILSRVVDGIMNHCKNSAPNEALGFLLGFKYLYAGKKYVKIIDWVTGRINATHTFAEITNEGIMDIYLFIKERYSWNDDRPHIVGVYHSHPFGVESSFSSLDLQTFYNPLFVDELNTFILIDPYIDMFKVYIFKRIEDYITLEEVNWCEYMPHYQEGRDSNQRQKYTTKRDN